MRCCMFLLAGLLGLFLVLQCTRAAPIKTVAVQYQLLSLNSGRLVAATGMGDVHAMGSIDSEFPYAVAFREWE